MMKKHLVWLSLPVYIVFSCATYTSAEIVTPEEKPLEKSELILPGIGYANFELGKTSQAEIIERLGRNYDLIKHNSYSNELYYKDLGVSFFFYQNQPERNLFAIHIFAGFNGSTEKGIAPGQYTIEEVIQLYGKPQWTSCLDCNYWTANYQGIGFEIDRDTTVPQFPFNEELHLKKTVNQIVVSSFD